VKLVLFLGILVAFVGFCFVFAWRIGSFSRSSVDGEVPEFEDVLGVLESVPHEGTGIPAKNESLGGGLYAQVEPDLSLVVPKSGWRDDEFLRISVRNYGVTDTTYEDRYMSDFKDVSRERFAGVKPEFLDSSSFGLTTFKGMSDKAMNAAMMAAIYWVAYEFDDVPEKALLAYFEGDSVEEKVARRKEPFSEDEAEDRRYDPDAGVMIDRVEVEESLTSIGDWMRLEVRVYFLDRDQKTLILEQGRIGKFLCVNEY
jgi:hypothetical protein